MGRDEKAAGRSAGVISADAAVDVAGIEWNVGVLGGVGLAGPDGGDIEGQRGRGWVHSGLRRRGGEDAERKLEAEWGHAVPM